LTLPLLLPPAVPAGLTDEQRHVVLGEIRDHCAPSTWDRLIASLDARGYPLDVTAYRTGTAHA
jgi:hypothetical protein